MAKLTASATWTDEELLALYREAAAELSVAKSTTIRGRTVTRADLGDIWDTINRLENRIAKASNNSTVVQAKHGRR